MPGYADVADVPALLAPPASFQDEMNQQIDDMGGKLGLIDDIWQFFFGWSLLRRIMEPITGDWGALRSAADGWDKLGAAAEGLGANLESITAELDGTWDGAASEAFTAFMARWAEAMTAEAQAARDMSVKVNDAADHVHTAFEVIVTTLNLVVDIILTAMRLVSIPVYGQIKAIKKAKEALTAVYKIFSLIKGLFDVVESFIEYVEALKRAWDETNDNTPWPSSAIDVPAPA
ncbi:MAG TPA: WXG100 family type VII secretion target [Pseudonocardiaceae bacterium]